MKELHDLELTLNSPTPILVIETLEEVRLLQMLTRIGIKGGRPLFQWTATDGLRRIEVEFGHEPDTANPADTLKRIKLGGPGVYLLLDFHPYLQDPILVRHIKEIAQTHEERKRTLVLVSHGIDIPPEIRHLTARFELHLPDSAALRKLIKDEAQRWQQANPVQRLRVDRESFELLAHNLSGMTETDAKRLVRAAIEDDGAITQEDLPELMKAKHELIEQGGVIGYEYDTAQFAEVAGLDNLKAWLADRRKALLGQSQDAPKGILLLGVQGGGKSLAAKAVAGTYGLPLLRMDFGALYNKYIGETEKNLRYALRTADTMAPCVLWIDEIEKGLAGQNDDQGISQRILGALLTWMAERKRPVFIVATSNDISKLPAELLRKGRLDEIFFVDLPDEKARKAIFEIHLRRRNLAPSAFNLGALASASEGFSGAEIEQAVVSARHRAQARELALNDGLLLDELERTQPLSVVMAEQVAALRAWAVGRTVPAH
ncbi:MAG: AAA family ATPase [Gammaproteobacteria bacterium]|nr:AAA family ATPase [Gammaproteobacteria bacterium]MBU1653810.1 AAA family ATPase [Gammaproteobacteria bacterium]MBU1961722.1 AAA family ATPase [Gammaproteobacteria bacterium]